MNVSNRSDLPAGHTPVTKPNRARKTAGHAGRRHDGNAAGTSSPRPAGRSAGILLHVTSLPGPYGVGDLGPAAYRWVDALARAKQTWWQILPLGPPGAGNSPYQCYSAFAGNPLLISPDLLVKEGLIARPHRFREGGPFPDDRVNYDRVATFKDKLLSEAWQQYLNAAAPHLHRPFAAFRKAQAHWLDDFSLFMALKEAQGGVWTDWPADLVRRDPAALRAARRSLAHAIGRHQFTQFLFFRQLDALRAYAAEKGVKLIGDLPIFISADSSDVWADPHLFLLDKNHRPRVVAGVPPDYFSETGQRWGNPLYDWAAMERDGYAWWVARLRATLAQVDLVRVDHFRGFEAYWQIPASSPTARKGRWVKGPGRKLFDALGRELGGLPLIAEDLGVITPPVEALRDELGLPGMRVLQFAFGGGTDNPYLPHNYAPNAVAYTGTHDNDTTAGWYATLKPAERTRLHRYAPGLEGNRARDGSKGRTGEVNGEDAAWALIRLAWSSVADCAIAPLQDVLGLGGEARMNTPGLPTGNWEWRYAAGQLTRDVLDRLGELTETYGRAVGRHGVPRRPAK